jgi:hypothetical protein
VPRNDAGYGYLEDAVTGHVIAGGHVWFADDRKSGEIDDTLRSDCVGARKVAYLRLATGERLQVRIDRRSANPDRVGEPPLDTDGRYTFTVLRSQSADPLRIERKAESETSGC